MYASIGLAAIAVSAAVSSYPLLTGHSELRQVRRDDLLLQGLADLRTSMSDFQVFVEPHMADLAPAAPNDLANGALLAQAVPPQSQAVARSLSAVGLSSTARDVVSADADFSKSFSGLSVIASGRPSVEATAAITAERTAFARLWALTAVATAQVRQARTLDTQQGMAHLDDGRATVLLVAALAAFGALIGAFALGQRARRRERDALVSARRQDFETALQQALDMSAAEGAVYGIVGRALHDSVPHLQVEMLVADSSRAHFHQTLSSGGDADGRTGCGVVSPLDCPATIRGHTMLFASSADINACPYLQSRPSGDCSAVCVAIGIAGKTVGVMHATAPDHAPPSEDDIRYIEVTSRRASERLAMLRAFEKSETQARSDPLTGLLNRRSLENQVRDLEREGTVYAVAYGDLDHFKVLNDTHGHEAGDQALRLFSRVLRDSVRPVDIAARYGGEEFVIVLPDCSPETATGILERVREHLALALTAGRVPAFTVSFGVAASSDADTFDDVVAVADHALLEAKDAGRNRVLVAVKTAAGPASYDPVPTPPIAVVTTGAA